VGPTGPAPVVDEARLRAIAFGAAGRLGLYVFGVTWLSGTDQPVLIDLNDWPASHPFALKRPRPSRRSPTPTPSAASLHDRARAPARDPRSGLPRLVRCRGGYLAPGTQSVALFTRLTMDHGEGALLYDADGNRYIDLLAGVGVASLGYAHPRYVAAMQRQLGRIHVGSFTRSIAPRWSG